MTLGLVGGTFDPIHLGHLDIAVAARRALGLDEVWLVPSRTPPHRDPPHASAAHRLAMVTLAAEDHEGITASDVEMSGSGPAYTADTVEKLTRQGRAGRDVFFITGADAFAAIATWRDYPHLLDRCHFVVVSRPGAPATRLRHTLPALGPRMVDASRDIPASPSIVLIDALTAPVSSTDVREACRRGASLAGLVPPSVAAYIARHGLYEWPAPSENDRKGAA
jgi:nicotinate-nucleotide adenylyltransferase